jgi:hypothetical protein
VKRPLRTALPAVIALALIFAAAAGAGLHIPGIPDAHLVSDLGSGSGGSGSGGSGSGGSGSGGGGTGPACSPSSPYLSVADRLYSVAGTSDSDVWAAGLKPDSSLIMHWDGNCWSVSYDQPVGYFSGVSAVSASDAWAVGGTSWWDPSQALAEHWDGTSWTRVGTPAEGDSAIFNGVAATSATSAWAVGAIGPGPGIPAAATPLIEHWDGTAWSAQSAAGPAGGGTLTAVAASSPDDAWAVGWTGEVSEGTGQTTLIEHWDGSGWTRVPSPDPAGSANTLTGVAVVSPDDVWAVGTTTAASGADQSLTLHWDGSTWTVVSSPSPGGDTRLQAVTAAASDDVWAVGLTHPTQCSNGGPKCATVALHWDGSTWTVASTPDPSSSYLNELRGVTAISGDDVWAVGTTDYAATLIEHWDGSSWRD